MKKLNLIALALLVALPLVAVTETTVEKKAKTHRYGKKDKTTTTTTKKTPSSTTKEKVTKEKSATIDNKPVVKTKKESKVVTPAGESKKVIKTTKTPAGTKTVSSAQKTAAGKTARVQKTTYAKKSTGVAPVAQSSTYSGKGAAAATALGAAGAIATGKVAGHVNHENVLQALETKSELSKFNAALQKEGLAQELAQSDEHFTIFAPTNAALGNQMLTRTQLESHILRGKKALTLRELEGRKRLNTTAHNQLKVVEKNRFTYVNGVKLSSGQEIKTNNGIIYIIDKVLPTK